MRAVLSLVVAFSLSAPLWAESPKNPPEDFSQIAAGAGLSAGFGLLRLGGSSDSGALPLTGKLIDRPNAALRVLFDPESGTAFGYRFETSPISTTLMGAIRVDMSALTPSDEKEVRRASLCPTCPPVKSISSASRFPPTQIIRDGNTMIIDLLVRPETGEKIVDVVRFSLETVTPETLDEVRAQVSQAFRLVKEGDQHMAHGGFESAAGLFAKAAELQPDAATSMRLARCYQRLDRLEAAQREYERAARLNPADAEAWYELGILQHRRGLFGKAASAYERALKLRPDWAQARRNLATARLDRAELDEAFTEYRQAYRSSPSALGASDLSFVRARDVALQEYVFAKVYAAEGELDAALSCLRQARDAGFRDWDRLKEDPEFKPFLTDPRVVALLARGSRS